MPPTKPLLHLKPITTRVQTAVEFVEGSFSSLHETITASLPEGRERALALTYLEQSFDWALKAVLRNQAYYSPDLNPQAPQS